VKERHFNKSNKEEKSVNVSERTGRRKIRFARYDSPEQRLSEKTVKSEMKRKARACKRAGQISGGDPSNSFYC